MYENEIMEIDASTRKSLELLNPSTAGGVSLLRVMDRTVTGVGGRLLAVDMDGKVQADTFGARSGQRLSIPETVAVLLHGEKSAFGIHRNTQHGGVEFFFRQRGKGSRHQRHDRHHDAVHQHSVHRRFGL